LSIGFGIKRASEGKVGLPEFHALQPALDRREPIPFSPFVANEIFCLDHAGKLTQAAGGQNKKARSEFPSRL
jgi:hypothetical protein